MLGFGLKFSEISFAKFCQIQPLILKKRLSSTGRAFADIIPVIPALALTPTLTKENELKTRVGEKNFTKKTSSDTSSKIDIWRRVNQTFMLMTPILNVTNPLYLKFHYKRLNTFTQMLVITITGMKLILKVFVRHESISSLSTSIFYLPVYSTIS